MLFNALATLDPIDLLQRATATHASSTEFVTKPIDADRIDLREPATRAGDYRRAACHCLSEHDAERLFPFNRYDQCCRLCKQRAFLYVIHWPYILDSNTQLGHNFPCPILEVRTGVGVVSGDDQPSSRAPGNGDSRMSTLDTLHTTLKILSGASSAVSA